MAKILPTFGALVRHFSSVDSLVLDECRFASERFPTFVALIRPFSSVDPLVLDECRFATEGFPTFAAVMRLVSTMHPLVLYKVIFAVKTLPALTTLITHLCNLEVLSILSAPCCLLATGDLLLATNQTVLNVSLFRLPHRELL